MFLLNWNGQNIWKNWKLLFLIISSLTTVVSPKHALYIGVIQIVYEQEKEVAIIQVKVFSDDLQSVLQNELGYENVASIKELCATSNEPIASYFKEQLKIKLNQQPIDFQLFECEQINDVHLLSFKTNKIKDWQVCSIEASFFMELFPLQSNIVNLKYIPTNTTTLQKMGRLTKGDNTIEFQL